MRWFTLILGLCLLLPTLTKAQQLFPVTVSEIRDETFVFFHPDHRDFLSHHTWHEIFVSPDGQKAAFLEFPLFALEQRAIEPGIYPTDLFIADFSTHRITSLVAHGDEEPKTQIFSGVEGGPRVSAAGAWDKPESWLSGGSYSGSVVWSPDSRFVAQLQSVVSQQQYQTPTVRVVVFDVGSGESTVIAEYENGISDRETGYGLFWLDSGIVLLSEQPQGNRVVRLFSPDGESLLTRDIESQAQLSSENPVRYNGQDYLHFENWSLYDVLTGSFQSYEGTIGLVSASSDTSLILEACSDPEQLTTVWDIYTPEGDKARTVDAARPALVAGGEWLIYTMNGEMLFSTGEETLPYYEDTVISLAALPSVWGGGRYIVTPIGAQDCHRTPRG